LHVQWVPRHSLSIALQTLELTAMHPSQITQPRPVLLVSGVLVEPASPLHVPVLLARRVPHLRQTMRQGCTGCAVFKLFKLCPNV
jgi:hypothetical protein